MVGLKIMLHNQCFHQHCVILHQCSAVKHFKDRLDISGAIDIRGEYFSEKPIFLHTPKNGPARESRDTLSLDSIISARSPKKAIFLHIIAIYLHGSQKKVISMHNRIWNSPNLHNITYFNVLPTFSWFKGSFELPYSNTCLCVCVTRSCSWPIFLHETPWFEYNCTRKKSKAGTGVPAYGEIFTSDWNKSQWCKGDAEVARKWSEFQTGCRPLNANLLTSFFQSLPHRLWSSPLSPFLDGTKVFSVCISVKKSLQHISLRGKMFATPSFGITVPLTSQRKQWLKLY